MGQGGGACNKCSDVSLSKNAPRALDEVSSEEEEEEDEGSEEENNDAAEKKDAEAEAKRGAELALQDGLKRGKTSTFTEAIEHSRALGLDEEKIQLAEKKLEDHKNGRRKEAFEAELHDFLRSEDANDAQNCEDKLAQGKEYGISDKVLKPVQDKILDLELMKELRPEEIEQAKQFLELCTRRFVASCMTKGRDVHWIDLESGSKHKAVLKMDVILKNFTVTGPPDGDLTCKVAEIMTKRAVDADEVTKKKGFSKLADTDQGNTVAVLLPSGRGPWCFLEGSGTKQDEFVIAFQVFNGLAAVSSSGAGKTKAGGKDKKVPALKGAAAADEEQAVEDSNLRSAAEGDEEEPANPVSPRGKGKKKTSERKSKSEQPPEEEKPPPPLPPPPDEEAQEEEAEAEEEAEEAEE